MKRRNGHRQQTDIGTTPREKPCRPHTRQSGDARPRATGPGDFCGRKDASRREPPHGADPTRDKAETQGHGRRDPATFAAVRTQADGTRRTGTKARHTRPNDTPLPRHPLLDYYSLMSYLWNGERLKRRRDGKRAGRGREQKRTRGTAETIPYNIGLTIYPRHGGSDRKRSPPAAPRG